MTTYRTFTWDWQVKPGESGQYLAYRCKMKLSKRYVAIIGNRRLEIEQDVPEVGWYLRIYENEKSVADHLQDSLEAVMQQAKDNYGVLEHQWKEL